MNICGIEREREVLKFGISLWHIYKQGVLLTARERGGDREEERKETRERERERERESMPQGWGENREGEI